MYAGQFVQSTQIWRGLLLSILLWTGTLFGQAADVTHDIADGIAVQMDISGAIGPAMLDYIQRGLAKAAAQQAQLVILRIDTPGGLDVSMREIIQTIIASPIPVVGFVAPGGARAASAGTYILYACHIAAMAPATTLGAATPVRIGGLPQWPQIPDTQSKNGQTRQPDIQDAITRKTINDSAAYIRGLAKVHGRNADWAEQAVREGASLTAEEALNKRVIDLIANNSHNLLSKLDERTVNLAEKKVTLSTRTLTLESVKPDWRTRLLAVIADPDIAYILILVGIYGLILEFLHPGTMIAGITGAISLLLALFAFQLLPINYTGLALMLFGITLMLAEAFIPGFGLPGIGGVGAFAIGSVMLIDTDIPGYGISTPLIATFTLISVGLCTLVLGMFLKSRKKPVTTGCEELTRSTGKVVESFDQRGWVRVHGELWQARTCTPLTTGQQVKITAMRGLLLEVEPCQPNHTSHIKEH